MITKTHKYRGFLIVRDEDTNGKPCFWVSRPIDCLGNDADLFFGYFLFAGQHKVTVQDKLKQVKRNIDRYLDKEEN